MSDSWIRAPDDTRYDQLIMEHDDDDDYNRQLNEALHASCQDLLSAQTLQTTYEQEVMTAYQQETQRRYQLFEKLLQDVQRISKIDMELRSVYEIIDPIIVSYCEQQILSCEVDKVTHTHIFHTLSSIRTDKVAIEHLKTVLKTSE